MLEKDYIIRLRQYFGDAIERITKAMDNEDYEYAKNRLSASYEVLGNDDIYFREENVDRIIYFFKCQGKNYIKKLEIVAELLWLDNELNSPLSSESEFLVKSKQLFEFCIDNSKECSFDIHYKLFLLNNRIIKRSH